jgi:hypothetical protein
MVRRYFNPFERCMSKGKNRRTSVDYFHNESRGNGIIVPSKENYVQTHSMEHFYS